MREEKSNDSDPIDFTALHLVQLICYVGVAVIANYPMWWDINDAQLFINNRYFFYGMFLFYFLG
jgi:hypothetical protein